MGAAQLQQQRFGVLVDRFDERLLLRHIGVQAGRIAGAKGVQQRRFFAVPVAEGAVARHVDLGPRQGIVEQLQPRQRIGGQDAAEGIGRVDRADVLQPGPHAQRAAAVELAGRRLQFTRRHKIRLRDQVARRFHQARIGEGGGGAVQRHRELGQQFGLETLARLAQRQHLLQPRLVPADGGALRHVGEADLRIELHVRLRQQVVQGVEQGLAVRREGPLGVAVGPFQARTEALDQTVRFQRRVPGRGKLHEALFGLLARIVGRPLAQQGQRFHALQQAVPGRSQHQRVAVHPGALAGHQVRFLRAQGGAQVLPDQQGGGRIGDFCAGVDQLHRAGADRLLGAQQAVVDKQAAGGAFHGQAHRACGSFLQRLHRQRGHVLRNLAEQRRGARRIAAQFETEHHPHHQRQVVARGRPGTGRLEPHHRLQQFFQLFQARHIVQRGAEFGQVLDIQGIRHGARVLVPAGRQGALRADDQAARNRVQRHPGQVADARIRGAAQGVEGIVGKAFFHAPLQAVMQAVEPRPGAGHGQRTHVGSAHAFDIEQRVERVLAVLRQVEHLAVARQVARVGVHIVQVADHVARQVVQPGRADAHADHPHHRHAHQAPAQHAVHRRTAHALRRGRAQQAGLGKDLALEDVAQEGRHRIHLVRLQGRRGAGDGATAVPGELVARERYRHRLRRGRHGVGQRSERVLAIAVAAQQYGGVAAVARQIDSAQQKRLVIGARPHQFFGKQLQARAQAFDLGRQQKVGAAVGTGRLQRAQFGAAVRQGAHDVVHRMVDPLRLERRRQFVRRRPAQHRAAQRFGQCGGETGKAGYRFTVGDGDIDREAQRQPVLRQPQAAVDRLGAGDQVEVGLAVGIEESGGRDRQHDAVERPVGTVVAAQPEEVVPGIVAARAFAIGRAQVFRLQLDRHALVEEIPVDALAARGQGAVGAERALQAGLHQRQFAALLALVQDQGPAQVVAFRARRDIVFNQLDRHAEGLLERIGAEQARLFGGRFVGLLRALHGGPYHHRQQQQYQQGQAQQGDDGDLIR